jgi:hypothetical protein
VQEFNTRNEQRSRPDKTVFDRGVTARLEAKNWHRDWLLGWRGISRSTDERTIISALIPKSAVGDTFLLAFVQTDAHLLQANLSSFVLDYSARQKYAGSSFKYYLIRQLPILPPATYHKPLTWLDTETAADWIRERSLELSFTTWEMELFAQDLGDYEPPFRWDEARRIIIRAELDAAYFHLYGLQRDDVEHVMDSFDALRRREERQIGEFRTKRMIIERYDALAKAIRTSVPYETILYPPPGHGSRHPRRDALKGADLG